MKNMKKLLKKIIKNNKREIIHYHYHKYKYHIVSIVQFY